MTDDGCTDSAFVEFIVGTLAWGSLASLYLGRCWWYWGASVELESGWLVGSGLAVCYYPATDKYFAYFWVTYSKTPVIYSGGFGDPDGDIMDVWALDVTEHVTCDPGLDELSGEFDLPGHHEGQLDFTGCIVHVVLGDGLP